MEIQNYLDNGFHPAATGLQLASSDPARGVTWAQLPDSDEDDVDVAVKAACAAFPGWSQQPSEERARYLNRIADLIEDRLEWFAEIESRDTGKPLKLARTVDIPRAVANLRFFAAAATQFSSEAHATTPAIINYTLRQPLGAIACISPWNLPLYLLTWKIAPALAAGNTVVAKPSEVTPATAHLLAEACLDAGLPGGVLNIIHGSGPNCGAPLVRHPDIRAVSFTGSTRTGEWIAGETAPTFRKISLELGGKNATIIFDDCDFSAALDGAVRAAFTNQGQVCLCGSRILVHRSILDRFRTAFVARVNALRVGDPACPETDQGAVVSRAHLDKVLACIELARQEGGTILCGGMRASVPAPCDKGWFLQPTVIEGLGPDSRTNREEIFGPVVTLQPFDDDAEALSLANASDYGLAASIWSRDISRCHRMAGELKVGIVWVNCWMVRDLRTPFGGNGRSGIGREGGFEAMRFFTEPRNVCIQL